MHKVKFTIQTQPPSRMIRLYKQIESAPPRTEFGPPYLHQHNPICDIFRFIDPAHETKQWDPYPQQNIILTPSMSDPLPCFGVPISVFCTNQTPLFYSFVKCTKTANDALHHFALIFHIFLPWQQSPISLGRIISPPMHTPS